MLEARTPPMKNLSVSKIETMILCNFKFKYKYLDHIPEPSGGTFLAGRVIHAILEHALKVFVKKGVYPSWQELDDMYLPTWQAEVAEEEEKPWFIGWKWAKDDPEEKVRAEYRTLIKAAHADALPKVKPWILGGEPVVEHRIELELDSAVGRFNLLGYIDLLTADGILSDWKTTDEEVSARAKRTWMQFAGYSLWAWPIVGEEELRCQKIFLIRNGMDPRVEFVPFLITPRHRAFFVDVAARCWQAIVRGDYLPNPESWSCSPKFCSFWGPCQGGLQLKP